MPQARLTAFILAAGITAILVLGSLPALEPQLQERRAKAAFSAPHRTAALSDDNLADAVTGLHLNERIAKVGWDHSMLSVDLFLREGLKEPAGLWSDAAGLVRFAFAETGNVRQLLIRVFRDTSDRKSLLLYGVCRREEWSEEKAAAFRPPDVERDDAFLRKLNMAATPAGARWLRNLANS